MDRGEEKAFTECWPSRIFKCFYTEVGRDQEVGIPANWKVLRNEAALNFSNDLGSCENGDVSSTT